MMLDRNLVQWLFDKAVRSGAQSADVLASESFEREAIVRLGQIESVSSAKRVNLRLRLFAGGRSALMNTSDISRDSLENLVKKTSEMLEFSEEDEACGLADPGQYPKEIRDLSLYDPEIERLDLPVQIEIAKIMEDAAFSNDPRIKNSEGGGLQISYGTNFYGSSAGFYGEFPGSSCTWYVRVIAESGREMQGGGSEYSSRLLSNLDCPARIGKEAAKLAAGQLGGRKVKTCEVPVVFSPTEAAGLLRTIFAAVAGHNVYQKRSFLCGKLGESAASPDVTIMDDGLLPGFLGTSPFDNEGVLSRRTVVFEKGVLSSYLLDSYSARKLGLRPTGNCGGNMSVAPSNFFLKAGRHSPEEIISSVKQGLYATQLMGFGVNLVTGDYSKGVRGLWIENGELTYPVEEVTIAGNLRDMLLGIEMVGNDLEFRSSIASPTLKISKMMISGI